VVGMLGVINVIGMTVKWRLTHRPKCYSPNTGNLCYTTVPAKTSTGAITVPSKSHGIIERKNATEANSDTHSRSAL